MTLARLMVPIAGLTTVAGIVDAHHSAAGQYDMNRTVEITGTVVDFRLISPHSVILLDVAEEDGSNERWEIETNSATNLKRGRGWDENTFQPGEIITVSGSPHRRDIPLMVGRDFVKADGTRPRERVASVLERYPADQNAQGISGRWLPPWEGQRSEPRPRESGSPLPLTPEALEAYERYNPESSPVTTCEPMNMPTIFYVGYLFDLRVNREEAVLRYELYDVTRKIALDSKPRQAEESGVFGISSGRIEGDELVIETSGFPPSRWGLAVAVIPLGNGGDVPSSEQKKVTERYWVSEDGQTLHLDYTVDDPVYLTEPYSDHVQMRRISDEAPMHEFNCDADAAARFTGLLSQ